MTCLLDRIGVVRGDSKWESIDKSVATVGCNSDSSSGWRLSLLFSESSLLTLPFIADSFASVLEVSSSQLIYSSCSISFETGSSSFILSLLHTILCISNCVFVHLNFSPQFSQWNLPDLVWTHSCFFNSPCRVNSLPQLSHGHLNGFSLLWTLMWALRLICLSCYSSFETVSFSSFNSGSFLRSRTIGSKIMPFS